MIRETKNLHPHFEILIRLRTLGKQQVLFFLSFSQKDTGYLNIYFNTGVQVKFVCTFMLSPNLYWSFMFFCSVTYTTTKNVPLLVHIETRSRRFVMENIFSKMEGQDCDIPKRGEKQYKGETLNYVNFSQSTNLRPTIAPT